MTGRIFAFGGYIENPLEDNRITHEKFLHAKKTVL